MLGLWVVAVAAASLGGGCGFLDGGWHLSDEEFEARFGSERGGGRLSARGTGGSGGSSRHAIGCGGVRIGHRHHRRRARISYHRAARMHVGRLRRRRATTCAESDRPACRRLRARLRRIGPVVAYLQGGEDEDEDDEESDRDESGGES